MKKILVLLFSFLSPLSAEIYDCFLFFNEFEILKIRLAELNNVVDYFVLIESKETFKGKPKPLFFKKNRKMFSAYLDKIIHVVIEKHPEFPDPWEREHFQRDAIMRGLRNLKPDDIVMLSDCDEIPRKEMVERISTRVIENPNLLYTVVMDMYTFKLNLFWPVWWYGTCASSYSTFLKHTPQSLRYMRNESTPSEITVYIPHENLPHGGWHFTSIGKRGHVRRKYHAYSHNYSADERIDYWLSHFPLVEIDKTFPKYVQKNIDHFISIDFIAKKS